MKPIVLKDVYDNVISIGRRVAYNYQGEVRIGHVTAIVNIKRGGNLINEWTKEPYICIHVMQSNKKISKVSKPKNLVVID